MSVLIETTEGDIVIDLEVQDCKKSSENFLKLCKIKYYNFCPVYNVVKNYTCQTGDPNYPQGNGGTSIWGAVNDCVEYFVPEVDLATRRHTEKGTVSMVLTAAKENDTPDHHQASPAVAGSQFIITLTDNLEQELDDKAAVFGHVVEGFDTLDKINNALCDKDGRPYKDIRIKHTHILEDPFEDPSGLIEPAQSPEPTELQLSTARWQTEHAREGIDESEGAGAEGKNDEDEDEELVERRRKEREAQSHALTLEVVGDLPFAEVKPKENVLFVCKLNPITQDEDLELIFSRFGNILSCEIVRDKTTGESLQYAFIEYEDRKSCEQAYMKMEGVLIDDRRIHVDFSQSVARIGQRNRAEISGGSTGSSRASSRSSNKHNGRHLARRYDQDRRGERHYRSGDNAQRRQDRRYHDGDRDRSRSDYRSPGRGQYEEKTRRPAGNSNYYDYKREQSPSR